MLCIAAHLSDTNLIKYDMSPEPNDEPVRRIQNPAMFIVREDLKVLIGIGLTWACVLILYYGLTHAVLDGETFAFPIFQPANLLIFLSAPMAQLALLGSEEEPNMDETEYDSWVELIPGAVMGLYRLWHGA